MFCTDAAPSHDEMNSCASSRSSSLTFTYDFHIIFTLADHLKLKTSHLTSRTLNYFLTIKAYRGIRANCSLFDNSLNIQRSKFPREKSDKKQDTRHL